LICARLHRKVHFASAHYKNSVNVFLLSAADAFIYLWDLRDARRPKAALQAVAGASKVDKMLRLVLWNRNYLLRFRVRLWKSLGSGSVPV
jgi:hypothetical protein